MQLRHFIIKHPFDCGCSDGERWKWKRNKEKECKRQRQQEKSKNTARKMIQNEANKLRVQFIKCWLNTSHTLRRVTCRQSMLRTNSCCFGIVILPVLLPCDFFALYVRVCFFYPSNTWILLSPQSQAIFNTRGHINNDQTNRPNDSKTNDFPSKLIFCSTYSLFATRFDFEQIDAMPWSKWLRF